MGWMSIGPGLSQLLHFMKSRMESRMKKTTIMTEGTIWKKILFFAIPLILGNLFQQLYNTADSIIVGNFIGSEALAAVGASGSVINLLIGFFVGTSAGAGVVTSQFFGAQDKEGVRKSVHTIVAIAITVGLVMTVAGILLVPVILRLMGTPKEVFAAAVSYLQVYFGGLVFSVIYNMCAGILNAVGNSKRSLVYLLIAAISNIFLDLLFVVVLKMGIAGAALATDISQLLSCIFILLFLTRTDAMYKVRIREIRFHGSLLGRIMKIGLPTGIQNIVISLSNVIVQSTVNSFGAVVMAGYAAYVKIDGFNLLPVMSIAMAATTFTGQNIGAGKLHRVKRGMVTATGMGIAYTILSGVMLLLFAPQVIGVFTENKAVVQCGVYIMKYFCPFYWILAILQITAGTIRGAGKTLETMLVFLSSLCLFRILWIWGSMSIEHSMNLLMVVYPLSWLVGAVTILIYAWKGKWMPHTVGKSAPSLQEKEDS